MNLVSDKWMPVVMPDGTTKDVSLGELFWEAETIHDLSCTPPQRIALMRLLICITQAALDGPEDEEDWFNCKVRIIPECLAYLEKWKSSFELYGENPFMQIAGLTVDTGKEASLDKFDCRLAAGNNVTLFDHDATPEGRMFKDPTIALALLAFMNFSNGGKIGQANWNGVKYSESTFAAPCIKYIHTYVFGENMLDALFFNLLTKNGEMTGVSRLPNGQWGRPVWERMPQNVDDVESFNNASMTYLGRLVPLSRFLRLTDNGKCIIGPTHKNYKIEHLPLFREPWAIIDRKKDGEPVYLRLSSAKHAWRQLGSILSLDKSEYGAVASLSLSNLISYSGEFSDVALCVWVGGLEQGDQAGKVADMQEWRFSVSSRQFQSSWLKKYSDGVGLADDAEKSLGISVKVYHARMNSEHIPYDVAKTKYWTILDSAAEKLFSIADNDAVGLLHGWFPILQKAMEEAYSYVCPRQSARQIEAYAQGLAVIKRFKPQG